MLFRSPKTVVCATILSYDGRYVQLRAVCQHLDIDSCLTSETFLHLKAAVRADDTMAARLKRNYRLLLLAHYTRRPVA